MSMQILVANSLLIIAVLMKHDNFYSESVFDNNSAYLAVLVVIPSTKVNFHLSVCLVILSLCFPGIDLL